MVERLVRKKRKGTFVKNDPRKGKGRAPGQPNKTTRVLREAVILAAELSGSNGRGKDGLVGYLLRCAKQPKVFVPLLSKMLPLQITGLNGKPVEIISSGMGVQKAAELYAETIRQFAIKDVSQGKLIEHDKREKV